MSTLRYSGRLVLSESLDPSRRQKTILIVEDEPDLRRIFATALMLAGFHVEQASDGVSALQIIENQPPDLVVLDVGLPTLDGLSVRDEIWAHGETRHLPVVIVTGLSTDIGSRIRGDCVLRKPVTDQQLVRTVRLCLPR